MKRLVFLFGFVFCSLLAYGQNPDLIVTTTGDSIQCIIADVGVNDIQFRIGTGNVISIKLVEVSSYEYNFIRASPAVKDTPKSKPQKAEKQRDSLPFYFALSGGSSAYGSVSLGETEGLAMLLGADAAYFFNSWIGAGVKFSAMTAKVDFGEKDYYSDMLMFYGGGLYGSFGKGAFNVNICASAGNINWKMSDYVSGGNPVEDATFSAFGCFFSAGVGYQFSKNIGIGLNLQSVVGKMVHHFERNPAGIGCSLGLNFRF